MALCDDYLLCVWSDQLLQQQLMTLVVGGLDLTYVRMCPITVLSTLSALFAFFCYQIGEVQALLSSFTALSLQSNRQSEEN